MEFDRGELVGGKYRLVNRLARGGMGEVWVARHVELEVDVAVKFMQAAANTQKGGARFRTEARAAAQLKSPHVVRVYDYGDHAGAPYLAMELLEGEDLQARLDRDGPFSPEAALNVAEQTAKALALAHSAGIVHRDIKPSNLYLAIEGGDEVLKVLDFGIAKHEQPDGATTSQGVLLGSPAYMSPEQARGQPVDLRSDLWSLSVVLFELLTGSCPFSGATLGDSIAKICREPLPSLAQYGGGLPRTLDGFFERGLARDPALRFGSAAELLEAFRAAVGQDSEPAPVRYVIATTAEHAEQTAFGRTDETLDASSAAVIDRTQGASLAASSTRVTQDLDERAPGRRSRLVPVLAGVSLAGLATVLVVRALSPGQPPAAELVEAAEAAPAPAASPSAVAEQAAPPSAVEGASGAPAPLPPASASSAVSAARAAPSDAAPRVAAPRATAPGAKAAPAPAKPATSKPKSPAPAPRDDTFGI